MPLTNVAILNAKPREKAFKISDGGGLHILIQPTGSKLWRLAYRHLGKQKLISFGPYPSVTLIEAREKREAAKKQLRDGIDPTEAKRQREAAARAAEGSTFKAAADSYIKRREREGATEKTVATYKWHLGTNLSGKFTAMPLSKITPHDVAAELLTADASGRQETARRLRWFVQSVFKHANATLIFDGDPTRSLGGVLPKRGAKRHHPAITDPAKFGALLAAIDEYDGWHTVRAALQIAALCFQRPYEIRAARWAEFDLQAAVWRIPAERMKMKRPHDVPLSKQAVAILTDLKRATGRGELVFPQISKPRRPLSENAMNAALRRMGYDTKQEHTGHGFRASASTLLNESGKFAPHVIDFQLAHFEKRASASERAYNRADYWNDRVAMMQAWADMCERFKALSLIG